MGSIQRTTISKIYWTSFLVLCFLLDKLTTLCLSILCYIQFFSKKNSFGALALLHERLAHRPGADGGAVVRWPRRHFGDTIFINDALMTTSFMTSTGVGRAQRRHVWASTGNPKVLVNMDVVFMSRPYEGPS
ncbi:hypothetical protein ZWY2020_032055 [Hordeum vulgare]|nr:hypothetical protein ZWY2020_032055 [Hordeum vulgare]